MVDFLISKEAKLEDEMLIEADHLHIIKHLLKRGANPTATDNFGNTLLHNLCKKGNMEGAIYLIQNYYADSKAKNRKGQTPLHLACTNENNLKMVQFLIEEKNADPAVTCQEGKTPLHYAARSRDLRLIKYLIEEQNQDTEATDNKGRTPLHLACKFDCSDIIKYLISEKSANTEAKDKKGKTAEHYLTAQCEKPNEHFYSLGKTFECLALILLTKAKAKVLASSELKNTGSIFILVTQIYDKEMQDEIENLDPVTKSFITGLQSFHQYLDKQDLTKINQNPLLFLANFDKRLDIAEYMFSQDLCYIEKHFRVEKRKAIRQLLLKSYISFSCVGGFLELTKFLLEEAFKRQAKTNEESRINIFDGNFLKTACYYKHMDIFTYLLEDKKAREEVTKFLNDFPLHFVCRKGSLEMVQYLVESKKVDIETKDAGGLTALNCAKQCGSIDIVQYLAEYTETKHFKNETELMKTGKQSLRKVNK